jgi:hypothetical protein
MPRDPRGYAKSRTRTDQSRDTLFAMVQEIWPLSLDSPRWTELNTRMGRDGERVRDALRALSANPSDRPAFAQMWPAICSDGTTSDAAFAAAPYLVAFAQRVPSDEAIEYLIVVGLTATDAGAIPGDLEPAYHQALSDAQDLALSRLADCPIDHNLRYLLAAVAAFRGRPDLASVLQNLDAAFPDELQQVVARDQAEATAS